MGRASLSKVPVFTGDGRVADTVVYCYIVPASDVSLEEDQRRKLTEWLRVRTKMRTVELVVKAAE